MSHWAPKPLRPMGTNGIFEYTQEEPIEKSGPNRWKQQRDADGSPYTRHGVSALTPPPAGPQLTLEGMEKAQPAPKSEPTLDTGAIMKSYLAKGKEKIAPSPTSCDEEEADDLEKTGGKPGGKPGGAASAIVGAAKAATSGLKQILSNKTH